MVRRHGWQLPAHTFQVVAITVFFLLFVAFFIFLAPFLWISGLEYAAFVVYSPLALSVFLLYVRCSAINPADPGVLGNQSLSKNDEKSSFSQISATLTAELDDPSSPAVPSALSAVHSDKDLDPKFTYTEQGRIGWNKPPSICSFAGLCGLCCGWLVTDDHCINDAKFEQPVPEEDILFCTLCNAEVRKYSKHCRSCDKCVDGFDHHCRWLNNCVGRKNYSTFVALMATSLTLLALEWGTGAAVFIRCFVDRSGTEDQIINKLGNGFSTAPFASVVLVCTIVAFLASIPLGELFFFHLILIRKGITTYEYVVAMRAQNEPPIFGEEEDSILSSPSASTATGMSVSSSLGLHYRGGAGWCTPPRIFVEHQAWSQFKICTPRGNKLPLKTIVEESNVEEQVVEEESLEDTSTGEKGTNQECVETAQSMDEVLPNLAPDRVPSTMDPDAIGRQHKRAPGHVRISAWKLSKLNADEASRAAAKARENSSVLQKLGPPNLGNLPETEYSSSSHSSLSVDFALKGPVRRGPERVPSVAGIQSMVSEMAPRLIKPSRLPLEPIDGASESRSSIGSYSVTSTLPESLSMSPLPAEKWCGPSKRPHSTTALGIRGDPGEPMPSTALSAVIPSFRGRSGWPTYQGAAISHPAAVARNYNPVWEVRVVSSDDYDASSGETVDDIGWSTRGRISAREIKRNPVFWSRPSLGKFGGDPSVTNKPPPRIDFRGSGISTSVFTSQQHRRPTWTNNPMSQSHASEIELASTEWAPGRVTESSSPAATLHLSPALSQNSGHIPHSGASIFLDGPRLPVAAGESTGTRRETSQNVAPKPPFDLKPGPQKPDSRPPSRNSQARSQSPIFAPRNVHL